MLIERHAAETYRLAAAIVGEADARDVAQEAFVAAWQQLPRLRDANAFSPWLRRICVTDPGTGFDPSAVAADRPPCRPMMPTTCPMAAWTEVAS